MQRLPQNLRPCPKSRAVTPEKEEAILRQLLEERTSIRGICEAFGCGYHTVCKALKKVENQPAFEASVSPAGWGDSTGCDEVGTCVGSKKNRVWVRLSWSFLTTQTLSFSVGARDEATGLEMWQAILKSYGRKQAYTGEYSVYEKLIPWRRHGVCPKGGGTPGARRAVTIFCGIG